MITPKLSQARIFTYVGSLPATKESSFVANRDIACIKDSLTGEWKHYIWTTSWQILDDSPIKGQKGDKGDAGTSTGGGSANIGGVRWVTSAAELNTAWQGVLTGQVRSIHFGADITVTQALVVPASFNRILEIDGHGFKLIVPSTIDTFLVRSYASLSEANAGIDMQLRVKNVEFVGANNVGIAVQAMYGAKIEGCRFSNFKTAYYGGWTMGTIIEQCFFWENNISIDLDYARFSGGSNSASQSNHSVIRDCKFRHSSGQFAAIKATAVSGLVIDHCIMEGIQSGPQYEVYFDDNGSTVVKDFIMTNCHIEQQQSVASVYIRLKDGYAYVSKVFSQYDCNLVKFESAGYAKCVVSGIPYLTAGTKFENVNSAGRWEFLDMPATFDPTVATWWKGTAPYMPALNSWQTSGQTKYTKNIQAK